MGIGIPIFTKTTSEEGCDGTPSHASAAQALSQPLGVGAEHAQADQTSPGVRLAQLTPLRMDKMDRVLVFCSIFFAAFAYSLDACIRPIALQVSAQEIEKGEWLTGVEPAAASSFGQHALVGAVNIVVAVSAAAFQVSSLFD